MLAKDPSDYRVPDYSFIIVHIRRICTFRHFFVLQLI